MINKKKLVLIGAGHAHLYTLIRLSDITGRGISVTVISPCCYYYSGMIPGVLGGRYVPDTAQLDTAGLVELQGGRWIEERAVKIDAAEKTVTTETGQVIPYDILSIDTGSSVNLCGIDIDPEAYDSILIPVRPFANILAARKKIADWGGSFFHAAVIGGGPAGVEVAGNLLGKKGFGGRSGMSETGEAGRIAVTLFAGKSLLPGFPQKAADMAVKSLEKRGAEIRRGARISKITREGITDENKAFTKADIILAATGVKLSPLLKDSGFKTGDDGGMKVDSYLQAEGFPGIFGGGDCVTFTENPLPKLGVFAVRQGPVLNNNLLSALEEKPENLKPYVPELNVFKAMNMGDGKAIGIKGSFIYHGRLMFKVKEYFDMKFIRSIKNREAEIRK